MSEIIFPFSSLIYVWQRVLYSPTYLKYAWHHGSTLGGIATYHAKTGYPHAASSVNHLVPRGRSNEEHIKSSLSLFNPQLKLLTDISPS